MTAVISRRFNTLLLLLLVLMAGTIIAILATRAAGKMRGCVLLVEKQDETTSRLFRQDDEFSAVPKAGAVRASRTHLDLCIDGLTARQLEA